MEVKGSIIITLFLPILIATIMFGLGLTLRKEDFVRVWKMPKSVLIGLIIKLVLLPLAAFGLCHLFELSPQLSIGLVMVAAAPSSAVANVFARLSKADLALSLCLTAIDNILTAVTLPLFVMLAFAHFIGESQQIGLQWTETVKIFALILFPVLGGMIFAAKFPKHSVTIDKVLRVVSVIVLFSLIVMVVGANLQLILSHYKELTGVVVTFNLLCFVSGYLLSRLGGLNTASSRSISMAMGIQGTALVVTIALTFLKDTTIAMPAAFFSLSMYTMAFLSLPIFARLK